MFGVTSKTAQEIGCSSSESNVSPFTQMLLWELRQQIQDRWAGRRCSQVSDVDHPVPSVQIRRIQDLIKLSTVTGTAVAGVWLMLSHRKRYGRES